MNIEFLKPNFINTNTALSVTAGTTSASNLYNRNVNKVWVSDTTTGQITVSFADTQTTDRIIIENTNAQAFSIYKNGTTATTFTLTSTANTNATAYTGNSATNMYLVLASNTAFSQIDLVISTTTDSAVAKVGNLTLSSKKLRLDENPTYRDFKPKINAKQFVFVMSDGGTHVYDLDTNYTADIKLTRQTTTAVNTLVDIYDEKTEFNIVPYPTVGVWAQPQIYEVNWVGPNDFLQPAGNHYTTIGFNGTIRLRETPK